MKTKKKHHAAEIRVQNISSIIALLIVLVAFSLFLLFNTYKTAIVEGGTFHLFIALTVLEMALLTSLMFLVNRSTKQ